MSNLNDFAHSFGLRAEFGMPQKAADEVRCFIIINIKPDQAISRMTPLGFIEIPVKRQQRWSS